jgi:hypothetical protein
MAYVAEMLKTYGLNPGTASRTANVEVRHFIHFHFSGTAEECGRFGSDRQQGSASSKENGASGF